MSLLGKTLGKVVAAPIKAVVALPETAAEVIEEVGKALDPPRKDGQR